MATVRRCTDDVGVDTPGAPAPAVQCRDCGYAWHSHAMADGLKLLGSCPKCGGELVFGPAEPVAEAPAATKADARAPHLVLGVPRR